MVIPVAAAFEQYSRDTAAQLKRRGLRVEVDLSDSRMNAKIRNAQRQKVPYMLILGEREMAEGVVSVRTRDGEQHHSLGLEELVAMAAQGAPASASAQ